MKINDFTHNKIVLGYTYGGKTGEKLCILHNNEIWFLKFPQNLTGQKTNLSYSTAPISEHLGSQIYKTIGIDTHDTELGIYANKPVVACRDFNKTSDKFYEFRGLLNALSSSDSFSSAKFGAENENHYVELSEIFKRMEDNFTPTVQEQMKERFWQMFVVDAFINNQDRNTGNWGYFMNLTGEFVRLAPVYDNGSSFFPKTSDEKIQLDSFFNSTIYNSGTPFYHEGKKIDAISVIRQLPTAFSNNDWNQRLKKGIIQVVPLLLKNINIFQNKISDIPLEFKGVHLFSQSQKTFYQRFLSKRLELILEPALKRIIEIQKSPTINISKPTGKGMER